MVGHFIDGHHGDDAKLSFRVEICGRYVAASYKKGEVNEFPFPTEANEFSLAKKIDKNHKEGLSRMRMHCRNHQIVVRLPKDQDFLRDAFQSS